MEYRSKTLFNENWLTRLEEQNSTAIISQERENWKNVNIPHNWEDYNGYQKLSHGNLHGTAWYRKEWNLSNIEQGKHYFIQFNGVGSYADVYLNEVYIGGHKGGLTAFCLEMTDALRVNENQLKVRAHHPACIKDLPWVCGGCFGTPNSEGSQPFGISRSVFIYETGSVRFSPFGIWITVSGLEEGQPTVTIRTELENLEPICTKANLHMVIKNPQGNPVQELENTLQLSAKESTVTEQISQQIHDVQLWSPGSPNLYIVESTIEVDGKITDYVENSFGMRWIQWENFEGQGKLIIDPEKLLETPSELNQNFSRYTRGSASSMIAILPGKVLITLPKSDPEQTIIRLETSIINRDSQPHQVYLESFIQTYNATKSIANLKLKLSIAPGEVKTVVQDTEELHYLDQWSEDSPILHGVYSTIRDCKDPLKEYNQTYTSFGIYKKDGPVNKGNAYVIKKSKNGKTNHRFLMNGKHIFINGTAEYQHLLGNDHAFESAQIKARVSQIKSAGFNAFREAHCPHDLEYIDLCDKKGILYWAQMGAHLYFDNHSFHENFIALTKEWVKERRNSPSLILWGIQNESLLPTYFTESLRQIIRSMDDTASKERMITTCNGGSGVDWNVPQNWSGTYGGDVLDYQSEIKNQLLIGEYGQYRVHGTHEEGNVHTRQNTGGNVSEELFCYCLENKIRLAEEVRESVYGHYQWIFNAHANPGRETSFCLDGNVPNDVGIINSKGLLTCWGEPVDAYYMYRSHYTSPETDPMVYIVSHTWPDRFCGKTTDTEITVYSNCDEVELFNGLERNSLGRKERGKKGVHFTFSKCSVQYNVLTAIGYVNGREAARDTILFSNLPAAPGLDTLTASQPNLTLPKSGGNYLYRINCGGEQYKDCNGSVWEADTEYRGEGHGWLSWPSEYENLDHRLGSFRNTSDFILGTRDQGLFKTYRYGRHKLVYLFQVPNGHYELELYFAEPWYGIGGGLDCSGWRLFDIAVNGSTVIQDFDIWEESGTLTAFKKEIPLDVHEGIIRISFPHVSSGQAIIHAIAVRQCP